MGLARSGVEAKNMKSFDSFAGFALQLGSVIATQGENAKAMLERVGLAVEKRAKHKIGDYQGEAGDFVAWADLADSTKQDRERQGFSEDEPGLRSGEMRDSIGHRASAHEARIGSDDDKLVWFELGTDKQPPRSVLGGALFELAPEIVEEIGAAVAFSLEGKGVFQGKPKIEP